MMTLVSIKDQGDRGLAEASLASSPETLDTVDLRGPLPTV